MIFKYLGKLHIFKSAYKSFLHNISNVLCFFKMARPVLNRLNFNLIKKINHKPLFFKNVDFCIFDPKTVK